MPTVCFFPLRLFFFLEILFVFVLDRVCLQVCMCVHADALHAKGGKKTTLFSIVLQDLSIFLFLK